MFTFATYLLINYTKMKTQIQFQFKIFAIILALSFSVSCGNAQENTTSGKYNGGIGYFQTGYSFFNQSKLNDILKASGMQSWKTVR